MTTSLELLIGSKNLSSWSLRPWLLLKHADIPFRERVLPLDTEEFHARIPSLSPTGKVPVLYHDGLRIWESLAICEYVAERFPEKCLWPIDVRARAVARAVSAEMHAGFASLRNECPMDVIGRHMGKALSDGTRKDIRRIEALWHECRTRYGGAGPFLFGTFSVADAMFAPVATRFRTYGIDAGAEYVDTLLSLSAMKEWERAAGAE